MELVEAELLKRVAHDLGITLANGTAKDIQIERLNAEAKALLEQNEGLKARVLAHEADIDALRQQVGAQLVKRRGK